MIMSAWCLVDLSIGVGGIDLLYPQNRNRGIKLHRNGDIIFYNAAYLSHVHVSFPRYYTTHISIASDATAARTP